MHLTWCKTIVVGIMFLLGPWVAKAALTSTGTSSKPGNLRTGTASSPQSRSSSNAGISPILRSNTMPHLSTKSSDSAKVSDVLDQLLQLQGLLQETTKDLKSQLTMVDARLSKVGIDIEEVKDNTGYLLNHLYPPSCSDIDDDAIFHEGSAVVTIKPPASKPTKVMCTQEPDGRNWAVVLRRSNDHIRFNRTFDEYAQGFGDPSDDYWIGNDLLHALTSWEPHSLRVQMRGFDGKEAKADYEIFSVAGPTEKYKLTVGKYVNKTTSTAGDGFSAHNGMKFSTYDQDNGSNKNNNCALMMGGGGGWWYSSCYQVLGTGQYRKMRGNEYGGITWWPWMNVKYSLKSFVMSIRPTNPTS